MFKRIAMIASLGALAAACASNPAPSPGMTTTSSGAVSLTGAPAATSATVANMAATTAWLAEEKLMPANPVLALVTSTGGDVDKPQGVVVSCNAANGGTTVMLGKQSAARVGQTATYKIRTGAGAQDIEGTFKASKSGDADFVFPIRQSDLLAMSGLDMVSILTDQGEVQWAFVKDVNAKPQAKYIASMKDLPRQAQDFVQYCNPK